MSEEPTTAVAERSEGDVLEDTPGDGVAAPEDAAGWRQLLAQLPPRLLLRDVQMDKGAARFIFQGFRGGPDALKNPVVTGRIVEIAQRNPGFARLLTLSAELALAADATGAGTEGSATAEVDSERPAPKAVVESKEPKGQKEDPRLKEKLKELRTSVLAREARVAALEAQAAQLSRDLAAARAEAESERKGRKDAEAAADRERRQREREGRRPVKAPVPQSEPAAPKAAALPSVPAAPAAPPLPAAFEGAMRRLLNRGRYAVAGEICRELLLTEGLETAARGGVHGLHAAALYAQSLDAEGEEQDRHAIAAYLDAGLVVPAAEAFARLLSHGTGAPLRTPELTLLQRMLALAGKQKRMPQVQETLSRLRVTAPTGYARLRQALQDGKKHVGLLHSLAEPGSGLRVSADETVALPVAGRTASTVTARRLVQAVERGDENFVTCARDGIEALRETDARLADALLEAVAQIHQVAVAPLTNLTRPVVVDASNVARHNPDALAAYLPTAPPPSVRNLLALRDYLLRRGFFPVLMIADANLRHHVDDRPAYLALLERGIVREVPGGTSADETLLAEARSHVAPLVTNDRMTQWGEAVRRIERLGFDFYPGGNIVLDPL